MPPASILDDDEGLKRLSSENPEYAEIVRHTLKSAISEIRIEIDRVEKFLAEFTNRGVGFLTVSGLISIIPFGNIFQNIDFLTFSLNWIFPYLAAGILFFFLSSRRVDTFRTGFSIVNENEPEELLLLRNEAKRLKENFQQVYTNYKWALLFLRLSIIFSTLFVISYLVNIYTFHFFGLLKFEYIILETEVLLMFGIIAYSQFLSTTKDFGLRHSSVAKKDANPTNVQVRGS